jgi:HD superfamily phosphohydrolase
MDYLSRDSFFTGVAEGVISYDRILKMLVVKDDQLMIEEKGIYSIEKFLVARRLMYWQVYLHKAVMGAEMLLVKIIQRAKDLLRKGIPTVAATQALNFFLSAELSAHHPDHQSVERHLDLFCNLDDYDVMCTIKNWINHPDKILSTLSRCLVDRKLLKIKLQAEPFDKKILLEKKREVMDRLSITEEEADYLVFTGEATNTTYDPGDERINILFKDGSVKDISQIDNALIHQQLSGPVKKYYICYYR